MQLKEMELNKYVSEINIKTNQSSYLPIISTSLSYAVNNSENGPAGLFANQLSNGLNAGVSLSWNVFDGGTSKVRIQNAKIDLASQALNEDRLKLNLESQLASYWADYSAQKMIIKNEELNVKVSSQNHL